MKVLIVDSNHEDTDIVASAIKIPWPDAEIMQCAKGETGLEFAARDSFDLIIVDLALPDLSGFEFLKRLSLFSFKPILVLKKGLLETDTVRCLQLGADECFPKPLNQLEFIAKSQAVVRRYLGKDEGSIVIGALRLDVETHRAYLEGREIALTRNENLALHRLMQNCGHVTSYNSLARAVWGNDFPGSSPALRVCVHRVRNKLINTVSPVNIINERGVGFRLVVPR